MTFSSSNGTWHCGDALGNKYSLSFEICESGDRRKTLLKAAKLIAIKTEELGLNENEIVKHFDWTGKNCPRILIDNSYIKDGMDWKWFIGEVKKNMASTASVTSTASIPLTQEQFDEMMDNYLTERAKDKPSDWSKDARAWIMKAKDRNILVSLSEKPMI